LLAGSSINNLTPDNLESHLVVVPKTLAEQTAIATVLSDMDTEIESLESKLAKAREIKQGMMQELLTGRIRLIEN
jgi:type I restriction enzyme S subunit